MDGFDVMPRTPRSTQRSSSPLVSHPRLRLSSHGLWFCSVYRSWSRVTGGASREERSKWVKSAAVSRSALARTPWNRGTSGSGGGLDQRHRPFDDVVDGEAELLERDLAGGAGAEVVDADEVVRVDRPTVGDPGLDRQRRHPRGQHGVAVVVAL